MSDFYHLINKLFTEDSFLKAIYFVCIVKYPVNKRSAVVSTFLIVLSG